MLSKNVCISLGRIESIIKQIDNEKIQKELREELKKLEEVIREDD